MMEIKLTQANFETEVLAARQPVLIDFYADWCGPCKMLAPILSEIAEAHPEIKVCKVNVDEEAPLAMQFGVDSIPLLVRMQDGKVEKTLLGYHPKSEIEAML